VKDDGRSMTEVQPLMNVIPTCSKDIQCVKDDDRSIIENQSLLYNIGLDTEFSKDVQCVQDVGRSMMMFQPVINYIDTECNKDDQCVLDNGCLMMEIQPLIHFIDTECCKDDQRVQDDDRLMTELQPVIHECSKDDQCVLDDGRLMTEIQPLIYNIDTECSQDVQWVLQIRPLKTVIVQECCKDIQCVQDDGRSMTELQPLIPECSKDDQCVLDDGRSMIDVRPPTNVTENAADIEAIWFALNKDSAYCQDDQCMNDDGVMMTQVRPLKKIKDFEYKKDNQGVQNYSLNDFVGSDDGKTSFSVQSVPGDDGRKVMKACTHKTDTNSAKAKVKHCAQYEPCVSDVENSQENDDDGMNMKARTLKKDTNLAKPKVKRSARYEPTVSEVEDTDESDDGGMVIEKDNNSTKNKFRHSTQDEPSASGVENSAKSDDGGMVMKARTQKTDSSLAKPKVERSARYEPTVSEVEDTEESGDGGMAMKARTLKTDRNSARPKVKRSARYEPCVSDVEHSEESDDDGMVMEKDKSSARKKFRHSMQNEPCTSGVANSEGSDDAKMKSLHTTSKKSVKKVVTPGMKKVYDNDKIHFCVFCNSPKRKIARHLLTHRNRKRIKAIIALPKRSKLRISLLNTLENEGNFKHNITVLQGGTGTLVVSRRGELASRAAETYTSCSYCKKFLLKKSLWRHSKTCEQYIACCKNERITRVSHVKRGKSLVWNAVYKTTEEDLTDLISRMRDDDIKRIALCDPLVAREAGLRMAGLGRKIDQKQNDIYRVGQTTRTLGKILQEARRIKPGITLTQLLVPSNFDLVINITKEMSIGKTIPALHLGKTIGMLLTNVCQSKYCAALRQNNRQDQIDATNFGKLIDTEWNNRINRTAQRQIDREKRNKARRVIQLTEDLQKFRHFLISNIRYLYEELKNSPTLEVWVKMGKFAMSRLILFNKRRRAEVRELKVEQYLLRPNWNDDCGEMAKALSPMDRLLAKR